MNTIEPIKRRFWAPSLTSQFKLCPVPVHLDTYRGCVYDCAYCFARDFTEFSRRNRPPEQRRSTYLEGNRPDRLEKWMKATLESDYDYEDAIGVAIKERIPMKIGATSDPFPPIESKEKITRDVLKVFHKYDYPVEIQTKNPKGLVKVAREFIDDKPNWTLAVTLISTDSEFIKVCEPNAPSPQRRLSDIKTLTDMGLPVMVKCQPAIWPKIMDDLPDIIEKIDNVGVWAFLIQGLKVRISMPKKEQAIMQKIGDYLGYDIRERYKRAGRVNENYEIEMEHRLEYCDLSGRLCKDRGIKFFNSDKFLCKGDGVECCGTEKLRNYKIWGNSYRSKIFGHQDNESEVLGKCKVNFTRHSRKTKHLTMDAVCNGLFNSKQTTLF